MQAKCRISVLPNTSTSYRDDEGRQAMLEERETGSWARVKRGKVQMRHLEACRTELSGPPGFSVSYLSHGALPIPQHRRPRQHQFPFVD